MTNYNDGNWHGWNGGECPVHPQSIVDLRWMHKHERGDDSVQAGDAWNWDEVCAFRVVKPYAAPREWWATGNHLHDTKEKADAFLASLRAENPGLSFDKHEPVLVREVLK